MKTRWIRELSRFSSKERTGIMILLLLIFLLILIGKMIPLFIRDNQINFSKWEAGVNTYLTKTGNEIPGQKSLNRVTFDPNKVDSITLVKMGLPLNLVANWVKYLQKGGRFRNKEGIKKIYGMTPGLFEQLDSVMIFPERSESRTKGSIQKSAARPISWFKPDTTDHSVYSKKGNPGEITLELNSTDSIHLLKIRGIGPVFASRIIRYRNLLGGFYAVSQLKEVYGLRAETFSAISRSVKVDPVVLKTFNLNFSTLQELGRHPYVGYRTARKLLRLRDQKGKFLSPEDLSAVLSPDSLTRLIPYLKFSQ